MIAMLITERAPSSQSTQEVPERRRTCWTKSIVCTQGLLRFSRQSLGFRTPEAGRELGDVVRGRALHLVRGAKPLKRDHAQVRCILGHRVLRVVRDEPRERG